MDTSDSECFESADESLQSDDDENTVTVAETIESLKLEDGKHVEVSDRKVVETKEECLLEKASEVSKVCDRTIEVRKERERQERECLLERASEVSDKTTKEKVCFFEKASEVSDKTTKETKEKECLLEKASEVCDRTIDVTKKGERANKVSDKTAKTKEKECLLERDSEASNRKLEELKDVKTEENLWADDEGWGDLDNIEEDPTLYDNTQLPADLKKGKLVSKYDPDEDKWEFDTWEPLNTEKPQQNVNSPSTWGGWGNWGVNSILSTATTLTTHVSQGLSNVLESGIGVPEPEELARLNRLEQVDNAGNDNNNPSISFGLGNFVSGVSQITKIAGVSHITKMVETTGTKVINSGLDTLETIGKKTMEVLQDGDPGLKKKRAFLHINQDKPVLSQILREAKEKTEKENRILEQKHVAKKANYESIFDDCQGLVHLEALEMLSRQCDIKLQTVLETYSGDSLKEVQETMEQVKELCEIPDEEDEETLSKEEIKNRLDNAVSEIGINITYEKLLATWVETEDWLGKLNLNVCNENELHQQAIETLAQLTAIAVEQFHKGGELLLVKEHRSTADEADSLVQLTTTLTALIGVVAGRFSDKLNNLTATSQNKEEINGLITNIFLEAANSSSYIQDAFQLLIPVLQVGAI